MNLQSWINKMAGAVKRPAATVGIFGQFRRDGLFSTSLMMFQPVRLPMIAMGAVFCAVAFPFVTSAQTNYYTPNGTEYPVIGSLPGDQMFPDAALSTNGGFVVWQDNATDGDGWGISARRLDSTLSGTLSMFRVNAQGAGDQQNARVTLLKNGGAAFVWQGGRQGYQHIFARYLTPANTWLTTTDLVVSAFNTHFQINPVITTLNNSNVVIVWSSFNQAGSNSLLDVYAKILSPAGATVKSEFLVNQFTSFNQRSPAVAALKNGGFVIAWVSEQQRVIAPVLGTNASSSIIVPSVDIYARLFQGNGVAVGSEFIVNTNDYPCANPAVAVALDGSWMVAWSGRDKATHVNGWDVYARSVNTNGVGGNVTLINTHVAGNQYAPHLKAIGQEYLVVWTSLSQDGSREGVYGRTLHQDGTPTSGEFLVNTTTASQQMQPAVVSDGGSQFLVIWTSFAGIQGSFDLFAQRYINVNAVLQAMPTPFVNAPFTLSNGIYQPQLEVSWAPLAGISVTNYEIYVDGLLTATTSSNVWIMTAADGLHAGSTHSFQVDYVKTDGARSPLSLATSKSTWDGLNWGGVPYEWMIEYYGSDVSQWPSTSASLAAGAANLLKVFLSGGNPLDSSTWLTTRLNKTQQGLFLNWNTQPGFIYQVQVSTNFKNWNNLGSPRFAAGTNDSINVGGSVAGYYQVMLLR